MTRTVFAVARKELTDIARDRRAVFVMVVLPIVIYPLLMIGFTMASAAQMRSLAERRYLQQSIGALGLLALKPLQITSYRDTWHRHLLQQRRQVAGAIRGR